jgi:hypothetical protein
VSGVAEQGHAGHPVPAVSDRQGVEHSQCGRGLAVGDQRGELGRPPVELLGDSRGGEVDAVEPVLGLGQRHVGVQDAVGFAVRLDPLAGDVGEQRARADRLGRRGVPLVRVEQVGLDEGGADVLGCRGGEQRTHAGPRPVGADQQVCRHGRAVRERHLVTAVAERADRGDLATPLDRA